MYLLEDNLFDIDSLKDCIWLFTSSVGYRVSVRALAFEIHKYLIVSVGNGHNAGNVSSLILTRYKESIPNKVVSERTELWLKRIDIDTYDVYPQYGFEVEQLPENGKFFKCISDTYV